MGPPSASDLCTIEMILRIDPAKFVARPGRCSEGAPPREQILEAAAELIPAQSRTAT